MDIDDIVDILCYGKESQIKKILKEYEINYSFSEDGEYTIENGETMESIRGYGIKNPNCVKYFGEKYKYSEN